MKKNILQRTLFLIFSVQLSFLWPYNATVIGHGGMDPLCMCHIHARIFFRHAPHKIATRRSSTGPGSKSAGEKMYIPAAISRIQFFLFVINFFALVFISMLFTRPICFTSPVLVCLIIIILGDADGINSIRYGINRDISAIAGKNQAKACGGNSPQV